MRLPSNGIGDRQLFVADLVQQRVARAPTQRDDDQRRQ